MHTAGERSTVASQLSGQWRCAEMAKLNGRRALRVCVCGQIGMSEMTGITR